MSDILEKIERGELAYQILKIVGRYEVVNDTEAEAELLHLARLGAARQWIPVSERLPKKGQICDIFARFGNGDFRVCEVAFTSKSKGFDHGVFPLAHVYNWRLSEHDRPPIPESPKEGGE